MNRHPQYRSLEQVVREHYRRVKGQEAPAFSIQFYPYRNLSHTIRIRSGRLSIRISDILDGAPEEVISALIVVLLHKLHRRTIPAHPLLIYRSYINQSEVRSKTEEVRRKRGRKEFGSARGKVFDLQSIFDTLNRDYFGNQIVVERLAWSFKKSKRVLGQWDPANRAIIINRRLDHPLVPESVVAYVVYHEMLHVRFGTEHSPGGRRLLHHRRFREAERQFEYFKMAAQFIRDHL